MRHDKKGNPAQDLAKARWYLNDAEQHGDPMFISVPLRLRALSFLEEMLRYEDVASLVWEFLQGVAQRDMDQCIAAVDEMLLGFKK
jgi:hypothetical protein